MLYLKFPVAFVGITQYFSARHRGLDLGWWDTPDPPIYAAGEGVVVACGTDNSTGAIFAVVRHEDVVKDRSVFTLYWHLRSLNVKTGQTVQLGDKIGVMGNTGIATGVHLHFETWVTPCEYVTWKLSDGTKYAVDPLGMAYLFPDQGQSADNRGVQTLPADVDPATGYKPEPTPAPGEITPGMKVKLDRAPLYTASTDAIPAAYASGYFYAWDAEIIEGRIRITNLPERVGVAGQVTGWIDASLFPADQDEKPAPVERKQVTVKSGDTLWGIATAAGLSLDEVIKLNPQIENPNLIYAGDIIYLS